MILDILPFIPKGSWAYRTYVLEGTIQRGARPTELMINTYGWMLTVMMITTDCVATVRIAPLAEQQSVPLTESPDLVKAFGSLAQDPAGWIKKYYRPNPQSTWGIYVGTLSPGFQGSPLPFAPVTKVEIWLPETSTQTEAFMSAQSFTIEIIDRPAIMKALKEFRM